jgi:hypothetical protein
MGEYGGGDVAGQLEVRAKRIVILRRLMVVVGAGPANRK